MTKCWTNDLPVADNYIHIEKKEYGTYARKTPSTPHKLKTKHKKSNLIAYKAFLDLLSSDTLGAKNDVH